MSFTDFNFNLPLPNIPSSILPFGTSVATAFAEGLLGSIIVRARNIAGLVADVTIREIHDDELIVTENPVEQGAAVTDHSFKAPAKLRVEVGYSNSSQNSLGDPNYVQSVYQLFLIVQAARTPFEVITGKRIYTNMLITRLHTETDEKTENALFLEVDMKEIILVSTQTITVPPAANMANPSANAATQSQGALSTTSGSGANTAAMPSFSN